MELIRDLLAVIVILVVALILMAIELWVAHKRAAELWRVIDTDIPPASGREVRFAFENWMDAVTAETERPYWVTQTYENAFIAGFREGENTRE